MAHPSNFGRSGIFSCKLCGVQCTGQPRTTLKQRRFCGHRSIVNPKSWIHTLIYLIIVVFLGTWFHMATQINCSSEYRLRIFHPKVWTSEKGMMNNSLPSPFFHWCPQFKSVSFTFILPFLPLPILNVVFHVSNVWLLFLSIPCNHPLLLKFLIHFLALVPRIQTLPFTSFYLTDSDHWR